jgi:hypothetical protein
MIAHLGQRCVASGLPALPYSVRNATIALIPLRYYRAVYAIASGLVLSMVVLLWQPSGDHLLVLGGLAHRVAQGGLVLAIALFTYTLDGPDLRWSESRGSGSRERFRRAL